MTYWAFGIAKEFPHGDLGKEWLSLSLLGKVRI